MNTIVLEEPGRFRVTQTSPPDPPGPGETLVAVRRVGICGTDLHAFEGNQPFFAYPRILGHELGVEVVGVGPGVEHVAVGDRCAVEPYLNCGVCIACRQGRTNCCASLKVLGVHTDGGMRERILVPAAKLHRSQKLTLEQLALVETLGIGAHAVDRARLQAGENVLVVGAGPIGLSVIQFAQAAGARVIVLDVNAGRLAFCREHLGVVETVEAGEGAMERIAELTDGEMPAAVFDATGNGRSMAAAFGYTSQGARVVFVGIYPGEIAFSDPEFHRKELTILATRNSTAADFRRIIGLIEEGRIDTTPWITHRAGCDTLCERFPTWLDPRNGVIKALLELQ